MRPLRSLIALLAVAAAASACGDDATSPTDADLVGTWSVAPAATLLPGGGIQQLTVRFAPGGAYALESATYAADDLLAFQKSTGSVSASGGELRFRPSSAVSVGLDPTAPTAWSPDQPVAYQVVGNTLFLRLAPLESGTPPVVLTRRGN